MLYTEIPFLLMFAVVAVANRLLLPCPRIREWFLIAFSLLVIDSWGLFDLKLFLGVLVVNYLVVGVIAKASPTQARMLLITAIIFDVAILALFKYANFFGDTLRHFSHWNIPRFPLGIPLAISFYTFHVISYLVDVYKRRARPTSFRHYLFYLSFFPHVIAGPIIRVWQLVPQIEKRRHVRTDIAIGIHYLVIGLFLKGVAADHIAQFLDPVWGTGSEFHSFLDRWLAAFLFYCQIYGDFAGYSLIALGMSRLLGYRLPPNFRCPMLASSLQEFWQRWHITLSRWLRDYLYIPLGGNRTSPIRSAINVLITMLIGGLWHGAGWGFLVWGAMHGIGIVGSRLFKPYFPAIPFFGWTATQAWILLTWVFFRTPDVFRACQLVKQMIFPKAGHILSVNHQLMPALLFALPILLHHTAPWIMRKIGRRRLPVFLGALTGFLLIAVIVFQSPVRTFIYFKF